MPRMNSATLAFPPLRGSIQHGRGTNYPQAGTGFRRMSSSLDCIRVSHSCGQGCPVPSSFLTASMRPSANGRQRVGEMEEAMAAVELKHVWKRYGPVTAVQDFCLTTADGEFIVLVGPSGCGKTSTMRMIAG